MITINNNIGNDIECQIIHENKVIGRCNNILSLYDALCQIKKEKSSSYKLSVKQILPNGETKIVEYRINDKGKLNPASSPKMLTWTDIFDSQLLFLSGFTNNIVYETTSANGK